MDRAPASLSSLPRRPGYEPLLGILDDEDRFTPSLGLWLTALLHLNEGSGDSAPQTMNWSSSSARWGPQPTCRVSKDRVRRNSQCRPRSFARLETDRRTTAAPAVRGWVAD